MRKLLALFLMFLMLDCGAVALPVSNMQSAVSGVIQQKAIKRGFAANDPRYGATLSQVSSVIGATAGTAAAVVVAGVTAPAWLSVLMAVGISTVVGYAVTMGIDGLVNWLIKVNTIDVSKLSDSSGVKGVGVGLPLWQAVGASGTIYGGDGEAVARQAYYETASTTDIPSCSGGASSVTCFKGGTSRIAAFGNTPSSVACGGGNYVIGGGCKAYSYPVPPPVATPGQTPQQAIDSLTDAEKAKKLNPVVVAAAANQAWQKAASKPDYDGIPYSVSDPITPDEVSKWKDANPDRYPTVGDVVAPQPSANQPWKLPVSPSSPTQDSSPTVPGINPSSQPITNLGVDPVIGSPVVEDIPTADQILKPIFSLMPGFKSFDVSSGGAQCPKPEFDALGKHYVVDTHCSLLEQNRALLAAVMAAVWSLASALVVLRA